MVEENCSHCGCVVDEENLHVFQDEYYCVDCLNELTVICAHCGKRIAREDNDGTADLPLCRQCYYRYYVACDRCGRLILQEDAYYENDDDDSPYCVSCHRENEAIHHYSYKPDPVFYGSGPRYLGIELEIDGAGEDYRNAQSILDAANEWEEHIYCKRDGSLTSGFEVVTHPMSLEYHCCHMPWEDLLEAAKKLGYSSHNTSTCGLHCHVNRDSLGDTLEEQDDTIARVLFFMEKHWDALLRFSRRTELQIERWASRYGYQDSPKDILKKAKGDCSRYTCLNLINRNTIEFRIFRGTLKRNTIIATLQLVDRICNVALLLSDVELQALTWDKFVSECKEQELVQYLKERGLYETEQVTAKVME